MVGAARRLPASCNIALIGHGPIARFVAQQLAGMSAANLHTVISRPGRQEAARADLAGCGIGAAQVQTDVKALPSGHIDLAIDCSGHTGLLAHGPALLSEGIDVVSLSTGALANADSEAELAAAARHGGGQLWFAIGAIGGIDALLSASIGGLDEVVYVARKPPSGWKGTPAEAKLDLDHLETAAPHFTGSAREAALLYPKNANVAATVAIAGLGLDRTSATLIADPNIRQNCHEIRAHGTFGSLHMQLAGNSLAANPKSSALAAMSMVRAVRSLLSEAENAPFGIIGNTLCLHTHEEGP